jgi:hypothetical protein
MTGKASSDKHYHEKVKTNLELMKRRREKSLLYYHERVKPFKEVIIRKEKTPKKRNKVKKSSSHYMRIIFKVILLVFD